MLSQSGEISPDFCRIYGGGIRHDEDIMHSFQNFIVRLIPNHPPPLETRIWKLVVKALRYGFKLVRTLDTRTLSALERRSEFIVSSKTLRMESNRN